MNRSLTEAACAYFALGAIGSIWLQGNFGFNGIAFHPYVVVVSFMAVREGLRTGLAVAMLGTLIFVISTLVRNLPITPTDTFAMFTLFPVAIYLGAVRDARRHILAEARETADEQARQIKSLRGELQILETANEELRQRVLGQDNVLSSLRNLAQKLAAIKADDLYPAIAEVVCQFLGAEQCSIYEVEEGFGTLKAFHGQSEIPGQWMEVYLQDDPSLLGQAVRDRRIMCLRDNLRAASTSDALPPSVISAPIMDSARGDVLALINVQKIPFVRVHGGTLRMLGVIADWAGHSLTNARRFSLLAGHDEFYYCFTPTFFRKRMDEEYARSVRVAKGTAPAIFSLMVVTLQGTSALSPAGFLKIMRAVGMILALNIRRSDSLGRLQENGFGLLLFNTDLKGAYLAQEKIVDEMLRYLPLLDESRFVEIHLGCASSNVARDSMALERLAEREPTVVSPQGIDPFADLDRPTRRRLEQAFGKAKRGEYEAAVGFINDCIMENPLEAAYRQALIRVYLDCGDEISYHGALEEYAQMRQRKISTSASQAMGRATAKAPVSRGGGPGTPG